MANAYRFSRDFPRKRAFITGAASGLGRSMALQLAADGWTLGITDIDAENLAATAKDVEQAGGKAFMYVFDVSEKGKYARVAEEFLAETGGVDVLVNNAGVADGGHCSDVDLENWEWLLGVNLWGVIYGCHYFIPAMKGQGSGCIINVASAAAFACAPGMGAYNVSKAAVVALSETLKNELRADGVSVSVVMPTFFQSNIMQHFRLTGDDLMLGQYMVHTSNLAADRVAEVVLKQAAKGRLHIIYPFKARALHVLKRLWPALFFKVVSIMGNKPKLLDYYKKKFPDLELKK